MFAGPPVSMHVTPEEDQVIENGNVVVYTVNILDRSGNPTTESKASVTCKVYIYSIGMLHKLNGFVKEPNISIYFFFPPMIQWCSISDVLFTGGKGVSDFSVLKYYTLNINYWVNILNECLHILIDCSQLSKTYYNMLFGSST